MDNLTTEQQGNIRLASAAVKRVTQKTASTEISSTSATTKTKQLTTAQSAQLEVTERTITASPTEESIIVGRERLKKEDENNLVEQVGIINAAANILKIQQTEAQQTVDLSTSITPTDRVVTMQSKTFASKKTQADATRALQKLQSKCNHKYNASTKNCEFCGKHRDSHIYNQ